MSAIKQIVLSLAVILIAAAGWYAYDKGYFASGSADQAAGQGRAGGGAGPVAGNNGPRAGGSGFAGRGGAVLVVTAPVGTDETGVDVRAIGTVAAVQEVTLYPQVSGIVTELSFKPGTNVAKGQTLVRLDDTDQLVAVEKAKIAADTAQSALDRAEQLAKTSNITNVALADATNAQKNAAIGLQAAQNDLAKRTITAPFAGTIGLSDISVGDLVSSSKAIATLDDMSSVIVGFDVPERASGLVAVGQPVAAITDALAGQTFNGTVSAVDNRVDPTARTLHVEATLPNDANALRPGMALTVSMSFPGQPHPSVPSLSVQWDRSGSYVWKVDGNVAHRVAVQILGRRSGEVIVSGALAANDAVVVEGLQRLREGSQVTVAGGDQASPPARPQGAGSAGGGRPDAGPEAAAGGPPVVSSGGAPDGAAARPRRPPSG